jgi:MFS family permease
MTVRATATPAATHAPPGARRYGSYVLWLLMLGCTLNFLDRHVVNILAEPIKNEFDLTDWQLGLLTGLAFAVFYGCLSLPVARLADRGNRSVVITAAVATWSLFTALSGLVTSYAQLLVARMFVGMGAAGGSPPSQSLICDYTPKEKRTSALAFYTIGIPLGSLVGLAFGGLIAQEYGWRTAFILAGAPGILLAVLMAFTLRDPTRGPARSGSAAPPLREALREIFSKRAFLLITAAGCLISFVNYGQAAFFASFFLRSHANGLAHYAGVIDQMLGLTLDGIGFLGLALGLSKGLSGVFGTLAGGHATDLAVRSSYAALAIVPAAVAVLRIPLVVAALLVADSVLALLLLAVHSFIMGFGAPAAYSSIHGLVQPRIRATAAAIFIFSLNLIGLGLGPLCFGLLSDALSASGLGPADGLRWALIITSLLLLAAAALSWSARKALVSESVS